MNRIAATAIGLVLAGGLVFAAPPNTPEEIATRILAADNVQELSATWRDWHPEAEHNIKVQIGLGQPDWDFSYRLSDLEDLPDWMDDPQVKETMQGYKETGRSEPNILVETDDDTTVVTAETRVDYAWGNLNGTMTQTDQFEIVSVLGRPVIRALSTIYDYR